MSSQSQVQSFDRPIVVNGSVNGRVVENDGANLDTHLAESTKHVDHATLSVNAGDGMAGGGFLTGPVTLHVSIPSLTEDTTPNVGNDELIIYSAGDSAHRRTKLKNVGQATYQCVVDQAGRGEYTSFGAALAAGHTSIYARNGTYIETSDIVIPDRAQIVGETIGGVFIYFAGTASSVKADAIGAGSVYSTGTVSIAYGSSTVTGVGTAFQTNASPGQFIKLCGSFYTISAIASQTSLTISDTFQGETVSGAPYRIQSMYSGILLRNIIVLASTSTGIYLRSLRNSVIENVAVKGCNSNIYVADCFTVQVVNGTSDSSIGNGIVFDRCSNVLTHGFGVTNCTGNAINVQNECEIVNVNNVFCSCNAGTALNVTGGSTKVTCNNVIFDGNAGKGVNTEPGTGTCVMLGCQLLNHGSDGVDFDGSDHVVSSCLIKNNKGYGVQAGDSGSIMGNKIIDNQNVSINLNGDHDCTVLGNLVSGGGSHGVWCNSYKNTIVGNRILGCAGDAIHLDASSSNNLATNNITTDNTGSDYVDNGTNNLKVSAHTHDASEIQSGTFSDGRISQSSVVQHQGALTHDSLGGVAANEHIDHTSVSMTAGDGLDGGGNIAESRSFKLKFSGLTEETSPAASTTLVATERTSDGALHKVALENLPVNAHTHPASQITDFATEVDARISAQKAQANGLATLDGSGKVPASQLTVGTTQYQGTWNASTNTPTLTSSTGTQGHYYTVSVAGSTNLDGITSWNVNDQVIFNGSVWEHIDNSDNVTSVAGKQGAVQLVVSDLTDSGSAATKDVGTTSGKVPEIGSNGIGNSHVLTSDVSGKVQSAAKGTAFNKSFGTSSGTVSEGNHSHSISSLTGYAASKFMDHSTLSVIAGVGMSGGGTIDDDVTLNADVDGLTERTGAVQPTLDMIPVHNAAEGVLRKMKLSDLPGANATGDVVGPATATDNAVARFDATTGKLLQSTVTLISDSGVATNLQIDAEGTGNVLLNIKNTNIKAAAGIDATKIADASVSNTEFQRLNGVTSNIQTQIDSITKTYRHPYTFHLRGEVKVAAGDVDYVPPFYISLVSGQTAKLVSCRYSIHSGSSATIQLTRNGSAISGYSSMNVTMSASTTNASDVTLSEDDAIALVVTAVGTGPPKNLACTVFIEYSQ